MFDHSVNEATALNAAVAALLKALENETPGTDEYGKMVDHLVKLFQAVKLEAESKTKILDSFTNQSQAQADAEARKDDARLKEEEFRLKEEEVHARKRISPDTMAVIAANLLGILLVLKHERLNIVTSKALGFITKLR